MVERHYLLIFAAIGPLRSKALEPEATTLATFPHRVPSPRAGGIKEPSITGKAKAAMKYLPPPEEMRTPLPKGDYFIIACVTLKKLATKIDGGHSGAQSRRGGQGVPAVQRVDKWSCYFFSRTCHSFNSRLFLMGGVKGGGREINRRSEGDVEGGVVVVVHGMIVYMYEGIGLEGDVGETLILRELQRLAPLPPPFNPRQLPTPDN